MNEVTVLHYSASVGDPIFGQRIREKLLENMGDLPLVSVTQEPLPGFGHNICVGRHDNCYANEFRQVQIGLQSVKTPYVLVAEADCLYPPEYFRFQPPEKGRIYRYGNVWVQYFLDPNKKNPLFYYKGFSDGAQIIDKELWLGHINRVLEGRPEWSAATDAPPPSYATHTDSTYTWSSENPVITFKTSFGVSRYTQVNRAVPPQFNLPFWGSARLLRQALTT